MSQVWNQLRPMNRYDVQLSEPLSMFEIKIVAQLYQPIIGSMAFSLYLTLLSEVEGERLVSQEKNHQWLINVQGASLDVIYRARIRLEAVGLLKTYTSKHEQEEETLFSYELVHPLLPEKFFEDDILNICLYNQIGTVRYRQLRSRFFTERNGDLVLNREHSTEVTQEFHEVFSALHPSELMVKNGSETDLELRDINKSYPTAELSTPEHENVPQYERYPLDIDTLKGLMMKGVHLETLFSRQSISEMKKLAYFYQLDEWSLSRLIHDSLTADDQLDVQRLRENAKELYRLQQGGKPPQIAHLVQPLAQRVYTEQKELTEEEEHFKRLEGISPMQLLEAYQGGGKVAEADLKLVEELLFDYQLSPSVVNILIEYIFLTNQNKLPRNLVTKVAAHWKRLKINDIKQANELAKREHKQYKEWKQAKPQEQSAPSKPRGQQAQRKDYARANVKKDVLPAWIEEQNQPSGVRKQQDDKQARPPLTEQQKRERMKQLMKELGEWD